MEAVAQLDPPGPTPATGDGFQVTGLSDEALATLLAVAGPGRDVPLPTIEARRLGGALAPGASEAARCPH
ncbi:hypothetical protein [Nonomuraea sp. JJY05]|uniref:hypothetical protein n=1 Tax=Nonomuraea sp. JJY05 TaxID=3350255 RepID=UPI00373EE9D8